MNGFNEDRCAAFIRAKIGEEASSRYSDDDILYVVDMIWNYYEKKGLLSLNDLNEEEEELLDTEELTKYVKKEIKNDGESYSYEEGDVEAIVKAELQYEESLDDIF